MAGEEDRGDDSLETAKKVLGSQRRLWDITRIVEPEIQTLRRFSEEDLRGDVSDGSKTMKGRIAGGKSQARSKIVYHCPLPTCLQEFSSWGTCLRHLVVTGHVDTQSRKGPHFDTRSS